MAEGDVLHAERKYKIEQVGPHRDWSFNDKKTGDQVDMRTFSIQVDGVPDWVDLNVKPEGSPKEQTEKLLNSEVEGKVVDAGKYGLKFEKARKGGGGGRGYGPGAEWANAVETATSVVSAYAQATGAKFKSMDEFLARIKQVAPVIKKMVDDFAGKAAAADKPAEDKTNTEAGESPATKDGEKDIVIEDIDDDELGQW